MNLYLFEANKKNWYTYGIIGIMADNEDEAVELAIKSGRDSMDKHFSKKDDGSDWGWHIARYFELAKKFKKGRAFENWENC